MKHLKFILLVFIDLIITAALLEGFFRYYFYRWNSNQSVPFFLFGRVYPNSESLKDFIVPSTDKGIVYEWRPNLRSVFGVPVVTNSRGVLGTKEFSEEKPKGTLRIVGVGDSVMQGWGVEIKDTYLALLGEELNKYSSPESVETINLSVPGYNTAIEKSVIEDKAFTYKPDLIILGYTRNDMDLPNYLRKTVHATSYAFLVTKYAYDILSDEINNRWTNLSNERVMGLYDSPPGQGLDENGNSEFRFASNIGEVPQEYAYMVGPKNYISLMKSISDMSKEKGVPVLLIIDTPTLNEIPELNGMGFHILAVDQEMNNYLSANNLSLKDVILNDGDNIHLNKLGHQIYSGIIYKYIMSDPKLSNIFSPLK